MDIIITSTAKIKKSLELRIIRIVKAQFLSKLLLYIIYLILEMMIMIMIIIIIIYETYY